MSSIFIPSLATVRKFGGMGHGQVQRRARRTAFGAKWPLKLSGSADLVKILLRITHRKCIVSGFERLVYQNICLILYLFQTSIYFYYVLEEIWVASTIMVLTRPDQPDPPKKRHLKSSFELFMGFWVYQWPTQWLRLGRLVGDARFVNEWKIETAEPTKTRVLEVVGCFSVMFVWEGWYFPPRLRTCKVPTSAWEIRSFTDARWMCLEPQPSEYSRGTWHLCIFPSKDGWEWWWPCVND